MNFYYRHDDIKLLVAMITRIYIGLLRQGNEISFKFVHSKVQEGYSVSLCCKALGLSRSGYYAWEQRPSKLISADTLRLYRKAKQLFAESRNSLGSRGLMKALRQQGFVVGRHMTAGLCGCSTSNSLGSHLPNETSSKPSGMYHFLA